MYSKTIALTAVFAALTISLNPAFSGISVPAPFFPYISYEIWEIPLIVIFLLIGFKEGTAVALINAVILLALFPKFTVIGSIIASILMLTGVYVAYRLVIYKNPREKTLWTKDIVIACTVGAIAFRTVFMAIFNYAVLGYPIPFGLHLPPSVILAIIPLIAIFNFTEPLYIVPIGYLIAKVVKKTYMPPTKDDSSKMGAWGEPSPLS
jgi:riboflavin transporter FmnP